MKNQIAHKLTERVKPIFAFGDVMNYQSKIEPAFYFLGTNDELPQVISFHESVKINELLAAAIDKYHISPENIWRYFYYFRSEEKINLDIFLAQIRPDLMLYCDADDHEIKVLFGSAITQAEIDELVALIKAHFQEELIRAESKIFLLYENKGLYLQDFKVKKNPMNLEENYNDDFHPIHDLIVSRLNTPDDKGIVLLHGVPGTGKTSYIRYLTSLINKKMIYIPPEFAYKIASPEFLPLLIDNPNSILIIEDAENIVEERDTGRNVSVSNLLNLADGLLSDCLNIQILCTFNTNLSKVDKALLRKGRLIASYEFKPLAPDKAQSLSDKLGFSTKITKPMPLTDVYNQKELSFEANASVRIGF